MCKLLYYIYTADKLNIFSTKIFQVKCTILTFISIHKFINYHLNFRLDIKV